MTLRPYQQRGVDAAMAEMRRSVDPCLIEAATGAGKSHIIAEIARQIHQSTGKRVLALAPSAELVAQNRAKYLAAGYPASMFSASAGPKDLRHPVVFGSPLTVANRISAFQKQGNDGYGLVIVDEAHGITPTLKSIIDAMRLANPRLRVLGLTATPYRLGPGYIYRIGADGVANTHDTTFEPYFLKCVAKIGAHELINHGFLTRPVIGAIHAEGYETRGMVLNSRHQFDAADVERAFEGHGRKTAAIVADIVAQSRDRQGVLLYGATVQHAHEILASLPPNLSAIITGNTKKTERQAILAKFLAQKIKYLVNVNVLTVGFDAPHVDVIAILRKTESVGLLQQIIGRGLRLSAAKADCVILDYTSNIEDHCPDGDLFDPKIRAKPPADGAQMEVVCPVCDVKQEFTINIDYAEFPHDENGYVLDLDGNRIESDYGPIPKHHGRRCHGVVRSGQLGQHERCSYRWTSKECPECKEPNDIAARYCISCKAEIVDPNEKLVLSFKARKKDPTNAQTDRVVSMACSKGISRNGNKTLRVEWVTPYRTFTTWLMTDAATGKNQALYKQFQGATEDGTKPPETLTYIKEISSSFYRIMAFNRPEDVEPEATETISYKWNRHAAE